MVIADLLKSWGLAGSSWISKGTVQANKNTLSSGQILEVKAQDTISGNPLKVCITNKETEENSSFSLH